MAQDEESEQAQPTGVTMPDAVQETEQNCPLQLATDRVTIGHQEVEFGSGVEQVQRDQPEITGAIRQPTNIDTPITLDPEGPHMRKVDIPSEATVASHDSEALGIPPYKKGHYTDTEKRRAKLLGLRILTEQEMHWSAERTVTIPIAGEPCECFQTRAGENLLLTRAMYETLESSYLLPGGARSSLEVFSNEQSHILLAKGGGMPYPTSWVDDRHRQVGV